MKSLIRRHHHQHKPLDTPSTAKTFHYYRPKQLMSNTRLVGAGKPAAAEFTIDLDHHFETKVYTTGSLIAGHVCVPASSRERTAFDKLEITLTGAACTEAEYLQHVGKARSRRRFLVMQMPVDPAHLPEEGVFEPNQCYSIPFEFRVPAQLPSRCRHAYGGDVVAQHHANLPPSLGESWQHRDQSPRTTQITYDVSCSIIRGEGSTGKPDRHVKAKKVIKLVPRLLVDPPLDVTSEDERYRMAQSKTIRNHLIALGKLKAVASEPRAVLLNCDAHGMSSSSLFVNLELQAPSHTFVPPKTSSIVAKVESVTYWSNAAIPKLPHLGPRTTSSVNPVLSFSTWHKVNHAAVEDIRWLKMGPSECRDGGARYSATLDMPFHLRDSNHDLYLPSFHTCLISRTYTLHCAITLAKYGTTISLSVPLQVAVEEADALLESPPPFEQAISPFHDTEAPPEF